MKLKGLVWFFTIALISISLYQLSFTLVTSNFENKITSKADKLVDPNLKGEARIFAIKDKARFMLDSLSDKEIYPILGTTYQDCKSQQLNLGLDLQGGMNVVLEVGIDELVRQASNNDKDPVLNAAIKQANARKANSGADFITLFEEEYKKANPDGKLSNIFGKIASADDKEAITYNSTNAQVITKLRAEAASAFDRTYRIIKSRIDKFGVAQPNINPDASKGIITVELAGVQNPEKIRNILQSTANLEFWDCYALKDIFNDVIDADAALKEAMDNGTAGKTDLTEAIEDSLKPATDIAAVPTDKKKDSASLDDLLAKGKVGAGKNGDSIDYSKLSDEEKIIAYRKEQPLRSYFNGSFENFVQNIQNEDGSENFVPTVAIVKNSDRASLDKVLANPIVKNKLPKDLLLRYGPFETQEGDKTTYSYLYALKKRNPKKDLPVLDGGVINDARADVNGMNGEVMVEMRMNGIGAKKWKQITSTNIGKCFAISLDNVVYSAPVIQSEIPNGISSITGSFTMEEAKDLANVLKTGKLPAPAKIVQEQVVGPTLGQEAVQGGMLSFFLSFIVIFILMLVYYNTGGWIANIALILNLLFTVGVLSALGASLTAAGIAGLVLTIGMAVDTNVIIFERIKEELEEGEDYPSAVDKGYKRSYAPVLDGHITVLMTAIILFIFGLGPVLGFATTQILGILLSLFCGIMVSRLITDIWMRKGRHFKYFTNFSRKLFKSFDFKFIQWRKKAYMISILVILLGIGALINGFNYGVEFSGGRSYTVRFDKAVKTKDIRDALETSFGEYPVVKTIGDANQVNITTAYKILDADPNKTIENEVVTKLYEGLKAGQFFGGDVSLDKFKKDVILSSQTVLPTISDDLKKGAIYATVISLLLIMAYIFIRFRRWQYSLGTIIALMHDVLVTLAVFSFFKDIVPFALEIDQHFIAAILTVIGFSMNDTVVVFDRIREYFRKRPGSSKTDVINSAINDTMSRTIMTSLTVFITLLILFIFGGEVTRGFSFAMMIGVLTGTYSSIFVAAPVLVDLDKSDKLTKEEDKEAKIAALKEEA
jgi:SecD/SecF fusion protein